MFQLRSTAVAGIAGLCFVLSSVATMAQDACAGVDQSLSDESKQEYAALAAEVMGSGVTPKQIEVQGLQQSGDWSIAYASTEVSDPGYFFFQEVDGKKQYQDVWGGIAFKSDVPEVTAWAEALGVPPDFAACFADSVTFDETE